MYDVNPNPDGVGLSLNIDEMNNSPDFELAIESSKYFGIKKDDAAKIAANIQNEIRQWKNIAEKLNISRASIRRMEICFKI